MPTLFRGNERGARGDVAGEGEGARSPVSCVVPDPGEEPLWVSSAGDDVGG